MPGLEPFNFLDLPDRVIQTIAKKQLTKSLSKGVLINTWMLEANACVQDIMTQPLSNESNFAIDKIFGNNLGK